MRIVGGEARGMPLAAPPGLATRPTPERAREALFSSWLSAGPLGVGFDAFAGSGAIGLEALSRGAPRVYFAEVAPGALQALRSNIDRLPAPLRGRARVLPIQAAQALEQIHLAQEELDWVFVDPPFAAALYGPTLQALLHARCVARDVSLVVEHPTQQQLELGDGWLCERTRKYGRVSLTYLARARVASAATPLA